MNRFREDVEEYTRFAAKFDTPVRYELLHGNSHEAISRIAGFYRVARSFSRKFDEGIGLARYEPVLSAIWSYQPERSQDPIEAVLDLTRDLKRLYRKEVLSASSKFLWFAWGREIIIYDSQALASIQTRFPTLKPKNYYGYCSAWRTLFAEDMGEIESECLRQAACMERWFHERVFDWHLWRLGKRQSRASGNADSPLVIGKR